MKQYSPSFLVGILLGAGAVAFMIAAVNSLNFGPDESLRKFEKRIWQESKEGDERMEMMEDVRIHYLRRGMNKKEIIKLLGKPDRGGHYEASYQESSKVMSYDAGMGFLDPCTFDLEFTETGLLNSYDLNCN